MKSRIVEKIASAIYLVLWMFAIPCGALSIYEWFTSALTVEKFLERMACPLSWGQMKGCCLLCLAMMFLLRWKLDKRNQKRTKQ